jgi:hypothetical protein
LEKHGREPNESGYVKEWGVEKCTRHDETLDVNCKDNPPQEEEFAVDAETSKLICHDQVWAREWTDAVVWCGVGRIRAAPARMTYRTTKPSENIEKKTALG